MSGSEAPSAHHPTLTEEQREALFRRFDEWLRAPTAGGPQKCHIPAEDGGDRPVCGRTPPDPADEWARKDPACFPGEWARLCSDCAELVARGSW